MNNLKVELLAPAGNYACFEAAIAAGADAVYLAGNRFGARAYADNFTEEELIKAIDTAHLLDKKVYMTVNTLLKQDELTDLLAYMMPYYHAGLDGVIVQDLGVFQLLKDNFPDMELHCSTQMTLTGVDGASFATQIGASRIVPARELGIEEIRRIHQKFPKLELECFIHGALCYCYSGQCLFSSLVGGRSGNRGTCAQPCRLPYDVITEQTDKDFDQTEKNRKRDGREKCEVYPLSLKDLSTIQMIPELIEAGIYSFKIEGRMKSAEYVAGVTGVYRNVIDRYLNAPEHFKGPERDELAILSRLYVRSETEEGYYHHYNGKHMITPDKPSYVGCDEETLDMVRKKYMQEIPGVPIQFDCRLYLNQPASLTVSFCGQHGEVKVTVQGDHVTMAKNKPIVEEDVVKQLSKTGGTGFVVEKLIVNCDDMIFMPISKLNELRRMAVDALKEKILTEYRRNGKETLLNQKLSESTRYNHEKHDQIGCVASVSTKEQLSVCASSTFVKRIYVDESLWEKLEEVNSDRCWAALPRIIRKRNRTRIIANLRMLLESGKVQGIYVYSIDGYELARRIIEELNMDVCEHVILSPYVYAMNKEAVAFWQNRCKMLSLPLELNEKEIGKLMWEQSDECEFEMMVYGRIPFMVTANCIRRNFGKKGCAGISGISYLKDRKHNRLPVINDCMNCYNIIYNSVPLSLHKHLGKIKQFDRISSLMLAFTVESEHRTGQVLEYYQSVLDEGTGTNELDSVMENEKMLFTEYTNGHFSRGVL